MESIDKILSKSRIILVNGYVDSNKATEIILQLLKFSNEKENEEIQFYVSAVDGNYLDVMAVYDTMKLVKTPIVGIGIGKISNYSALILAACSKGKRYALKHTSISLRQPITQLDVGNNQQTQIAINANQVTMERKVFEETLSALLDKPCQDLHADCELGVHLTSQEAVSYGLIDKVI